MGSTFFGLTIAGSALNSYHVATNTVANNISNANTAGYTRQEAVRVASEALRTNQKYGMEGSGVTTTEIAQKRDFYYDVKYWENSAKVGMYDVELYYMQQFETYLIDDDSSKGFGTILDEMFAAMEDLKKTPDNLDARKAFISKSQNLTSFFKGMTTGFKKMQQDCNEEIANQIEVINGIAQKVALLNKQINVIELQGTNANELRDQRALLIDQLSSLVPVTVKETKVSDSKDPTIFTGATNYVVKINGQTLVDSFEYNTLTYVAREEKVNEMDADGLYDIFWNKNNIPFNASGTTCEGRLKGLFDVRDGNNNEGFTGKIKADSFGTATITNGSTTKTVSTVTIEHPSIREVGRMTMPPEGKIIINNTEYKYTKFSYDDTTETYEFVLDELLTSEEQTRISGRSVAIGTNIDAMGVPYYQAQANLFLREFAKQFNLLHLEGVDLDDIPGDAFFVAVDASDGSEYNFSDYKNKPNGSANESMSSDGNFYYLLTADNIQVADALVKDPRKMVTLKSKDLANGEAIQDIVERMLKLKSEVKMFRGGGADGFLKTLISDNAVDTQKSEIFLENYTNISETIVQKRMSISAVDEDEEALDMLKYQHAYNLASRMIQTMSEMYDRLILETGV